MGPSSRHSSAVEPPGPWAGFRAWAAGALVASLIGVSLSVWVADVLGAGAARRLLALGWAGMERGYIWQPLTFQLVHADVWELLLAVGMVWFAGRQLEPLTGARHLWGLFFWSGLCGGIVRLACDPWGRAGLLAGSLPGATGLVAGFLAVLPPGDGVGDGPWRARRWVWLLAWGALCGGAQAAWADDWRYLPAHLSGVAGCWLYLRRLGWVRPCGWEIAWERARAGRARLRAMGAEEFIRSEIDPILDRISAGGGATALRRRERRLLRMAREKIERGGGG